jgi:hypothetical protein
VPDRSDAHGEGGDGLSVPGIKNVSVHLLASNVLDTSLGVAHPFGAAACDVNLMPAPSDLFGGRQTDA